MPITLPSMMSIGCTMPFLAGPLAAGQRVAAAQRCADHSLNRCELLHAQTEFPVARTSHAQLPLPCHTQHPCQVLGGNDVQRSALSPGSDECFAVEQPINRAQRRRTRRALRSELFTILGYPW